MAAEFGIALGTNLVTECVKSISRTIKQQILYVFKYQSYTSDLNTQVQELRHKIEREQLRVDHAIRQGDDIHTDVGEWLTKVNQFIGQRTASMYVRDYEAFDSREVVLREIMEPLKDASVNSIGVYGMGGVGKTTLVNQVAWKVIEDELFDDVVMAEVTQKPDKRRIQEKVASDLGLLFEQHENEFDRAHRLRNRLKKGKRRVLVILDNIWAKPDFEAIGIPFGGDGKESALNIEDCKEKSDDDQRLFKILLTSRSLDVLRNDVNIEKIFRVETVSPEEAENLFWRIVGEYHSAKSSTDFWTVAEILGKCAGLPLAIAAIANELKNKSIDTWEHALDQLRTANPRSIPEVDERVVSVVELSVNLLRSDEAKNSFCSAV
ncbi:Disease resistance protein [Melia azedarach]|uniref:Disease resistance protein n=1 Tax=Melia azedarach TaxID=155640 RepID=A0ACC1Y6M3_MELAZ|nr:Disease resistance protein [Melia azedarach]